jgi:hypothetical protein
MTWQPIPGRIVIGVTGHRKLEDEAQAAAGVREALKALRKALPELKHTPVVFSILSPLAEGADRLVAREAVQIEDAQIEVVLPLEKDDYLSDFESAGSKAEFKRMLTRAVRVKALPHAPTRNEAYERVGRYVVDHCDVLIALWNGQPAAGRGGTAEIVVYAREKKIPLLWVHTAEGGRLIVELGEGFRKELFQSLDRYNGEKLATRELDKYATQHIAILEEQARAAGLKVEAFRRHWETLAKHYSRADILALRYQRLYYKAGSMIYALAAAAATTAAFQGIFLPQWPRIALIEVLFIAVILAIVRLGNLREWHDRWIDYRFLAERFRSAFFLSAAQVGLETIRPPRMLRLVEPSREWIFSAFASVWNDLPPSQKVEPILLAGLKRYLLRAWVNDQKVYHRKTSLRHGRRHMRISRLGLGFFAVTFAAALMHALHVGPGWLQKTSLFLAIASPILAGTLAAVRTHREYDRNSKRSAEMALHLEKLTTEMEKARTPEELASLVRETEETMLHENEDWRVVVRFHELEPLA